MRIETYADYLEYAWTRGDRTLECDRTPRTTPRRYRLRNPHTPAAEWPEFWAEPWQLECPSGARVVTVDGEECSLEPLYGTTARLLRVHGQPRAGARGWPVELEGGADAE